MEKLLLGGYFYRDLAYDTGEESRICGESAVGLDRHGQRHLFLVDRDTVLFSELLGDVLCGYGSVELFVGSCGIFEYKDDVLKLFLNVECCLALNIYLVLLG